MGIMICKTHGRVGFVETCSHIAKQIDGRKLPNGRRLNILGNLFVCNNCFNSLGFERFMSLADLPFEEAIRVDDGVGSRLIWRMRASKVGRHSA
jgi:hypothetical protein